MNEPLLFIIAQTIRRVAPASDFSRRFTMKAKHIFIPALCALAAILAVFGCAMPSEHEENTFTVTFDSNGGSAVAPKTGVKSGATIALPENPARDGYEFGGWYTDNGTFRNEFTASAPVSANITVYAKWNWGGGNRFAVTGFNPADFVLPDGCSLVVVVRVVKEGAYPPWSEWLNGGTGELENFAGGWDTLIAPDRTALEGGIYGPTTDFYGAWEAWKGTGGSWQFILEFTAIGNEALEDGFQSAEDGIASRYLANRSWVYKDAISWKNAEDVKTLAWSDFVLYKPAAYGKVSGNVSFSNAPAAGEITGIVLELGSYDASIGGYRYMGSTDIGASGGSFEIDYIEARKDHIAAGNGSLSITINYKDGTRFSTGCFVTISGGGTSWTVASAGAVDLKNYLLQGTVTLDYPTIPSPLTTYTYLYIDGDGYVVLPIETEQTWKRRVAPWTDPRTFQVFVDTYNREPWTQIYKLSSPVDIFIDPTRIPATIPLGTLILTAP
jgi:uncharacterized repeat protein (TIGR02543 family)